MFLCFLHFESLVATFLLSIEMQTRCRESPFLKGYFCISYPCLIMIWNAFELQIPKIFLGRISFTNAISTSLCIRKSSRCRMVSMQVSWLRTWHSSNTSVRFNNSFCNPIRLSASAENPNRGLFLLGNNNSQVICVTQSRVRIFSVCKWDVNHRPFVWQISLNWIGKATCDHFLVLWYLYSKLLQKLFCSTLFTMAKGGAHPPVLLLFVMKEFVGRERGRDAWVDLGGWECHHGQRMFMKRVELKRNVTNIFLSGVRTSSSSSSCVSASNIHTSDGSLASS